MKDRNTAYITFQGEDVVVTTPRGSLVLTQIEAAAVRDQLSNFYTDVESRVMARELGEGEG